MKRIVSLFLLIAGTATASAANQELLKQVADLFESKCAECHNKDGDSEDPPLHAKIDLSALRNDDKYVTPGSAEKSSLFQRVVKAPDDKKRMPKSKGSPGDKSYRPPLTSGEVQVLQQWIEGGQDSSVAADSRGFAEDKNVEVAIQTFLQSAGREAEEFRFLSLSNLFNARDAAGRPAIPAEELARAKSAVDKALNSVSNQPAIKITQAIDKEHVVLRLRLRDYGWTASTWERLAGFYPFSIGTSDLRQAAKATGSKQPWMRADWFVFTITQPPFYHELLNIPGGRGDGENAVTGLEQVLGFTGQKEVRLPGAVRSGFESSGVSQGNRVLERLPLPSGGYYWRSYDFRKDRKNEVGGDIFQSPLGPVEYGLSQNRERLFVADGGEIVYSLPNGLQGYMLVDSKFHRLDRAPLDVVRDDKRADGLIINGISCIGCHAEGMFIPSAKSKDEIALHANSMPLDRADREQILRLYSQERLDAALKSDQERFESALAQCGVATGAGTTEPVKEMYDRFRKDISSTNLAAEIGRDISLVEILNAMVASKEDQVRSAAAKFREVGYVPRLTMLQIYPQLASQLNLGPTGTPDSLQYEEFVDADSSQVKKSGGNADGILRSKENRKPVIRLGSQDSPVNANGIKVTPRGSSSSGNPVIRLGDSSGSGSAAKDNKGGAPYSQHDRKKPVHIGPDSPSSDRNGRAAESVELDRGPKDGTDAGK